jgi:cytochrome c553
VKPLAILALTTGLLPFAVSAAPDRFDPAAFHAANCTRCHGTEVYTRPERRVTDLERLRAMVRMCDANVGTQLFDEDMAALTRYLNDTYYQFPQ